MLKKPTIYLLVGAVFLLKLILLPFSETTDADAVSRIFLSIRWADNPHWIMTDVWGPFHYYLNGIGLMIWEDRVIMPKLINIVLSCLTLFPFYFFSRREFNEKGALFATLFLALCPILFRTSFMAMSNIPFLFFLALALNELSKGRKSGRVFPFVLAGVFLTVASGFRYEAWLIMAIFGVLLLVYESPKKAILFSAFAVIFPLLWMYSNWLEKGNPLYSINGNYRWTHEMMGVNEDIHWKEYIKRLIYFPYSWLILVGVPTAFYIVKYGIKTLREKHKSRIFWMIPLLVLSVFMVYNSVKGNLLNQHRFTGTLVLFSLPLFTLFFEKYSIKKRNLAFLFLAITIGFSFFQIGLNKQAQPFPIVKESYCNRINKVLAENDPGNQYLILDFLSWQSTYNIALKSNYHPSKIYIQEGAKHSKINPELLIKLVKNHDRGIVIYKKNSVLHQFINTQLEFFETKLISQDNDIFISEIAKRL